MKRFWNITSSICVILTLTAGTAATLSAQEMEALVCSTCSYENITPGKYCGNCGESLSDESSQWLLHEQESRRSELRFISDRVDPPRLFSVPTASVLGSMDINLMGGGAFGVATDQSFLGTIGVGLGDIAEVEFSSVGMVTNIARGSTVFPTSAFKLLLIPEGKRFLPALALAFRSSSNWQDVQSDRQVLSTNGAMSEAGITEIGYDTRFTTMYGVTAVRFGKVRLHGGVSLTDVRIRDFSVLFWDTGLYADPAEKQVNLWGGFAGFDVESNPQTKLMFELRTDSNYHYNVETKAVDVTDAVLAIGGVRFFFNHWLSIDTGVWYHSSFRGIADMQLKIGMNVFFPASRFIGKRLGARQG